MSLVKSSSDYARSLTDLQISARSRTTVGIRRRSVVVKLPSTSASVPDHGSSDLKVDPINYLDVMERWAEQRLDIEAKCRGMSLLFACRPVMVRSAVRQRTT
ncbi:hypothetical protein MN608_03094 [Microdochium nivale]|nr:hypothetical protein MN608_03094 [Microdochium nivale]